MGYVQLVLLFILHLSVQPLGLVIVSTILLLCPQLFIPYCNTFEFHCLIPILKIYMNCGLVKPISHSSLPLTLSFLCFSAHALLIQDHLTIISLSMIYVIKFSMLQLFFAPFCPFKSYSVFHIQMQALCEVFSSYWCLIDISFIHY